MSAPSGLNATPCPLAKSGSGVDGSEYLESKPESHAYTVIRGLLLCAIAISEPSGLNVTPFPVPVGSVDGSEYLEPKPELLHE